MFTFTVVQTHKNNVKAQLKTSEIVPRLPGPGTQPAVVVAVVVFKVVEFELEALLSRARSGRGGVDLKI